MAVHIIIFLLSGVLATLGHQDITLAVGAITDKAIVSTTSVVPNPTPSPSVFDDKEETNVFNVTNSQGKICILFKGLIKLDFVYRGTLDQSKNKSGSVYLPSEARGTKVSGSCDDQTIYQTMNLTFYDWTLELFFMKNETKQYSLEHFRLSYQFKNGTLPFPDAEPTDIKVADIKMGDNFIPELSSYVCFSQRTLVPDERSEIGLQEIKLANVQYEAFVSLDDALFSTSRIRCKEDKISNLVPIAVGVALAVLIVIVLVAYLIGRHRSRRGYEAV